MRADSQNVVQPSDRGRKSVRIRSNKAYDEAIVVLDLQHMPEGCATWPAFWSLSQQGPWPNGGEIDIIEGTSCLVFRAQPAPETRARSLWRTTELRTCSSQAST